MFADDEARTSRRVLGQVIEWLVWSAIVGNSESTTHVFLPLDDRGVDGVVRRVEDEAMCAVQVQGRTSLGYGEIQTVVRRSALDDPKVTFVVVLLDPRTVRLGETVYVLDAKTVLRLGGASHGPNGPEVELRLPYRSRPQSKWARYACELAELPSRLFPSAGMPGRRVVPLEAEPEVGAPAVPRRRWSMSCLVTWPSTR